MLSLLSNGRLSTFILGGRFCLLSAVNDRFGPGHAGSSKIRPQVRPSASRRKDSRCEGAKRGTLKGLEGGVGVSLWENDGSRGGLGGLGLSLKSLFGQTEASTLAANVCPDLCVKECSLPVHWQILESSDKRDPVRAELSLNLCYRHFVKSLICRQILP